jgi:hypothetical protein
VRLAEDKVAGHLRRRGMTPLPDALPRAIMVLSYAVMSSLDQLR